MASINSSGYSDVNGLRMYYEVYGKGNPLVLIHGGGSTIQTSFGNAIPFLSKRRQLIGVELQAHGHTADRDADLSFEQDADDVAALLKNLGIPGADFLGYSNGACTVIEIALRHTQIVDRVILASGIYARSGAPMRFWEGFDNVTLDMMPRILKEGYLKANNSQEGLENMFRKDVRRMQEFTGWTDERLSSITAPALVINATKDVGSPEHAVHIFRTIPNCELAIFPGGHGTYLGTAEAVTDGKLPRFNALELINGFLDN